VNNMKFKLLAFFVSLMLASMAMATTTSCQIGSLTSYLAAGFSCQSGSLIFSDFDYQGTGRDASSIAVTPLNTSDDEGFRFQGGWYAHSVNGASISEDSRITYTVHHAGGLIDTLSLAFGSSVSGTGVSTVQERFCLGASLLNCPSVNQGGIGLTNPGSMFSNRAFFAGVGSVSVWKDINVTSGVNGTASISNVTDTFSSPEPLSFVLLGTGLLGIGLMRRRLSQR
jgi:hypothetical protein